MIRFLLFFLLAGSAGLAGAAQEVRFWYTSSGAAGALLEALVERYNAAQARYRVVAIHQEVPADDGALSDPRTAKARSAQWPHLLQLDDSRTAGMMSTPGLIRPMWQVMAEARVPVDPARLVPALTGKFMDRAGKLVAWPIAGETPVLYGNKALLRSAGLDPDTLPRTWYEMPKVLGELYEKGIACPYTTAWPSWVQLENLSAWHNQAFATRGNGLAGTDAKLAFNTQLMVRHVAMLASWAKARYFIYAGRGDAAERRFARGECALLTSSSGSYSALREAMGAELGVAALPYYDDFSDAPQNTLAKGSALWISAGKPAAEYRGVADFLSFLSRPEVQAEWHQKTGLLPLTREAYELTRNAGYYREHAGQEAAVGQMLAKAARENSRGIRLPHFAQIRDIIEEELEAAWSLQKMPKEALDAAVERGNKLLQPSVAKRRR